MTPLTVSSAQYIMPRPSLTQRHFRISDEFANKSQNYSVDSYALSPTIDSGSFHNQLPSLAKA
jgi:hypothetical protein